MVAHEQDDEMAEALEERVKRASRERKKWSALRKAFSTSMSKQAANYQRMKDIDQREKRLQKVREETLLKPELIVEAVTNMEKAGFRVRMAMDAKEALDMVIEEMGDENLLVKSKTNVSKEVNLTHAMSDMGYEVVETDLGDRIIQISDEPGAHPTGPAAHLDRYDIAKILSEYAGRELEPDPRKLTDFVLEDLSGAIDRARVGLTGANSIGAEEGAILLVQNEGNITKVSMRPWKHIILTAIDKVYPNLDEALNAARLQTFYATGAVLTSYINIIGGPSKTADIEKKLFEGIHGPEEVVVILLDNGRSQATGEMREVFKCIGCGNCLLHCPVYDTIALNYGESPALGGRGVGMLAVTEGLDAAIDHGLFFCTQCELCESACPAGVDAPGIISALRKRAFDEDKLIDPAKIVLDVVNEHGTPYGDELADMPGPPGTAETVLYVGCAERRTEETDVPAARRVLDRMGMDHAFVDEKCCQALVELLGGERDPDLIEHNRSAIVAAGAKRVVTLCPTCAHILEGDLEGTGIDVMPFIELVARADLPVAFQGVVTYHDPCDLGRKSGRGAMGFDAPRKAIAATGATLKEMPRSREDSKCCGGGGGLRATYPALSVAMAKQRMEEIRTMEADYCLTDCPSCVHNLRNARKRKDHVQIMTTVRWLDQMLEHGED
jgi:L-lactate dehydrogenase complex protein LldG